MAESKLKTKDRILETALALFNENGTARVTTNHIAKTMGISPGNLYYHYRNKEAIVLQLWECMVTEITVPFSDDPAPGQPDDFFHFIFDFFRIVDKYRFFWLEIKVLIEKDPELKIRYTGRARNLLGRYKDTVYQWRSTGFLRSELTAADLDNMIETTWFLTQFWALHTFINEDRITAGNLLQGADRILSTIRPYLSQTGIKQLESLMASL